MSDTALVEFLKEVLTECPICTETYCGTSRIPRRMPCCGQAICENCLEIYSKGSKSIPCPLCRKSVDLPAGVKHLSKDMTTLRFLDLLKTQRDAVPLCTDCPDSNQAMSKCDECEIYLCQPCLNAHARHRSTRYHTTTTFQEIKVTRSTRLSSSIRKNDSELKTRLLQVEQMIESVTGINDNLNRAMKRASPGEINAIFVDLMEELNKRGSILMSAVTTKTEEDRKSIKMALESHVALQKKLQEATPAHNESLLKEEPNDIQAQRIGVTFSEANYQDLITIIRSAGQVRVITFIPTEGLTRVPDTEQYDVIISADEATEVTDDIMKISIGGKDITRPNLEFDHKTSSPDVSVSSGVISNKKPDPTTVDTGCRLDSRRRALSARPITFRRGQVVLFCIRVVFTVTDLTPETKFIWETAFTPVPVDTSLPQPEGVSLRIASCSSHTGQLCLKVRHLGKLIYDVPLLQNKIGVTQDLQLYVVIDSEANKVQIVDTNGVEAAISVNDVVLDKPIWVLMYVDSPSYSNMRSELISGNNITVTQELKQLMLPLL